MASQSRLHKPRARHALLVTAGFLALSTSNALADVMTSENCSFDNGCSLAELFDGGYIVVDQTIFGGWSLLLENFAAPLALDEMFVYGNDSWAGQPGLIYDGGDQLELWGRDYGLFDFSFSIEAPAGSVSGGALIGLDTAVFSDESGMIQITTAFGDSGSLLVYDDRMRQEAILFDSAGIVAEASLLVENSILMLGDLSDMLVGLELFTQYFSVRPGGAQMSSPGTVALLALGLFALGWTRRYRRLR